jgi:hypothetical protein
MLSDDVAEKCDGDNEKAAFMVFEEGAIDTGRRPRGLSDILCVFLTQFSIAHLDQANWNQREMDTGLYEQSIIKVCHS